MKTVSKTQHPLFASALALTLLLGAATASAQTAQAAPAAADTPPPALAVGADTAAPTLPTPPSAAANTAAGRSKNISALEDKVSDSVKNVVKQLSTIDSVNLDDLNTARQAVVKLEMLIEIEKRLAELDKIHSDRNGASEKALAAAIPASALSAPLSMSASSMASKPSSHASSSESLPSMSMNTQHTEVTRVSGADGHYTAIVQGKVFRVGDSLPDGSTVTAIAAKQVTTKAKDGAIKQLKIKGVDEIYGHTL